MTTLTIKFKDRKQALMMKKLAKDFSGVEEIKLSPPAKKNGGNRDRHFQRKYGVTEKEFYTRIRRAEEDIKAGRVYPIEEVMKRMKQRHAKDAGKL